VEDAAESDAIEKDICRFCVTELLWRHEKKAEEGEYSKGVGSSREWVAEKRGDEGERFVF